MKRTIRAFVTTLAAAVTLLSAMGCGSAEGDEPSGNHLAQGAAEWPNALVDDGSNLYFTDLFSSMVHKVSKSEGKVSRLYGSKDDTKDERGMGIALDDTHVYAAFYEGKVVKIPRNGGQPLVLASDQRDVLSVAVHGERVFWTVGYIPNVAGGAAIMTVGTGGGEPSVFVSGQIGAQSLVVHGTNLYWFSNGAIRTMPVAGGEPTDLVTTTGPTDIIAIQGGEIFWPTRGTAGKAPLEGGPAELLSSPLDALESGQSDGIAADDEFVYFTNTQARTVTRIPRTGGQPEIINPDDALGEGIVVDAEAVYYADATSESIVRLPK